MVEKKKSGRKKGQKSRRSGMIDLLMGVFVIFLINYIASFVFTRFDLTSEKRYTLSTSSRKLISSLDDVVFFKVYLEGEFPAGFTRLKKETREMLDEFRAYAGEGKIEYEFINPSENPDMKIRNEIYKQLYDQGLRPTDLEIQDEDGISKKIIWPGAVVTYKGRRTSLQLLKSNSIGGSEDMLNNSIEDLEYELSNAIQKLVNVNKPKIAFIEGHGELNEMQVADISRSLEEYYVIDRLTLAGNVNSLTARKPMSKDSSKTWIKNEYEAIIIAKPVTAFTEKDKFLIDQYIMYGGKVLWLLDPVSAEMDSLTKSDLTMGLANDINLTDQLFTYGVRLNSDLVLDLQSAPIPLPTQMVSGQPRYELFPWYYFPLLVPNSNHPVVNNLNAIKGEFMSSLDTVNKPEIRKTPLLTTSKYTKLLRAPVRISLGITKFPPQESQYNKSFTPVAYLLEGTFNSVFKNRITQQIVQSDEIKYREKGVPTKMIVAADGDLIKNRVRSDMRIMPLGLDQYTGQEYGNKDFIMNAVNFLCDDEGLMNVRSRTLKIRLLDRAKLQKEQTKWQLINTVVPVLLVIIFGLIHHFIRKRRYTQAI